MKTLATIYKGIINPITTHINNQDLTLSQLQALQQTHHTQQSLSQLPKQHLINLILDLQKQIIPTYHIIEQDLYQWTPNTIEINDEDLPF